MPGAADMVVLVLPPTATYKRRDAVWLPCDPWFYPDGRDGDLTLVVQHSRRAGAKVESDSYAVQVERDQELPPGVWSFLLDNEVDPDPEGPFRCVVGGMFAWCGCEAGRVASGRGDPASCKHAASLAALTEQGAI